MHQVTIKTPSRTFTGSLPASWKEIGKNEWVAIAPYLISGDIYNRDIIWNLLRTEKWGVRFRVPRKIVLEIPPEQMYDVYSCISWLLTDNCTDPPFEAWKLKGKWYYMPASRLQNISLIEYAFLDLCYNVYQALWKKQQYDTAQEWMIKLACYMARPIDPRVDQNDPETFQGDRREKFNTIITDRRMPLFREAPMEFVYGCAYFFLGCKRYIHQRYKNTIFYDTHDSMGNEVIGVSHKKPSPQEWIRIAFRLSGGKFGGLRDTQYSNLYDVLEEMNDQQLQKN